MEWEHCDDFKIGKNYFSGGIVLGVLYVSTQNSKMFSFPMKNKLDRELMSNDQLIINFIESK